MSVGFIFLLFSFIYSLFLNILYFNKKHVKNYETKIFGIMITVNFVGILLETMCILFISKLGVDNLLTIIVNRLFLIYLLSFVFLFMLYVLYISFIESEDKIRTEKIYIFTRKVISAFYLLTVIISMVCSLHIYSDNNIIYSYGPATKVVFVVSTICVIICIVSMIKNYKKLKNKKYLPLFIFILLGSSTTILQYMFPSITLTTSAETFLVFIMYFTIENPDVKMIEQLNVAKDQAEKANRAKTDFLSSMSHEIRTPLNAIMGFSNGLLDDDLPTESKEDVNNIIMASNSLLELVNGILDISKIEANKLEIINVGYNFHKMFDEVVLLTKARLGDKPLEFNYNYDESIPEYLYGDATRIKQVIINLLTNSVKYTKEGSITFNINSVIKNNIVRLIITVEDTGIGIKKESIDKLFTKFERLGVERNTTTEGTGLGLAITKRLVELMGGKIVVQSIYGKGSKFGVAIDQRIVQGNELEKLKNEKQEVKEVDIKNLNNKKVLIVDDNILNIKVAQRLLKPYNLDIDTSLSGLECLDKVRSGNQYDLILLDDMMPKMSGVETLNKLKEINGYSIPTVALTANAITGMREKYLNDGFDDYLGKPIERNELDRVLKKYLNK